LFVKEIRNVITDSDYVLCHGRVPNVFTVASHPTGRAAKFVFTTKLPNNYFEYIG